IPVKDEEETVPSYFQCNRHEPGVIGGQQIWLRFRQIGRAIALKPVPIDAAAMNIAHANAPAVSDRKRVRVEKSDPAIGCLLVTVVGDGTQLHRKGRVSARLPFVVARFNKMKEMIVRPMTGF